MCVCVFSVAYTEFEKVRSWYMEGTHIQPVLFRWSVQRVGMSTTLDASSTKIKPTASHNESSVLKLNYLQVSKKTIQNYQWSSISDLLQQDSRVIWKISLFLSLSLPLHCHLPEFSWGLRIYVCVFLVCIKIWLSKTVFLYIQMYIIYVYICIIFAYIYINYLCIYIYCTYILHTCAHTHTYTNIHLYFSTVS